MHTILALAEQTKRETGGYFDIARDGQSTLRASSRAGRSATRRSSCAIAGFATSMSMPAATSQICGMKRGRAVARRHPQPLQPRRERQDPRADGLRHRDLRHGHPRAAHLRSARPGEPILDIVSLTVIGPDVYEADRFATAAFAMGTRGIHFIEQRAGLEGYQIDRNGIATFTSGFERLCPAAHDERPIDHFLDRITCTG